MEYYNNKSVNSPQYIVIPNSVYTEQQSFKIQEAWPHITEVSSQIHHYN